MIGSLERAKEWCDNTRRLVQMIQTLGRTHWDKLDWSGPLGQDERAAGIPGDLIAEWADATLRDFDDLSILILFSAFEAEVRTFTATAVDEQMPGEPHAALRQFRRDLDKRHIGQLAPLYYETCRSLAPDLPGQVGKVIEYRNWVAHGGRGLQPATVITPDEAFNRLQRFLTLIRPV